jgi:hypothetical protein
MDDDIVDLVFQCDYCGTFVSINDGKIWYTPRRPLADGRMLMRPGTYCSNYCGDRSATASVSGGLSG